MGCQHRAIGTGDSDQIKQESPHRGGGSLKDSFERYSDAARLARTREPVSSHSRSRNAKRSRQGVLPLDTDALSEQLAVVGGVTEEQL